MMTVAESMKQYIDDAGLKQKVIAQRANMREDTVSIMLNNKRKMTIDEYVVLCRAIGVSPTKFISESA